MGVLVRWTSGIDATGEIVWFWSPDAGIKFRKVDLRNDGGNKARSPGRARISRNTIARGMPDCFGEPAVSNSCAFYFAHEAAGALCIRHSLRPLFSKRDMNDASLGHFMPRECFVSSWRKPGPITPGLNGCPGRNY
jgi:hypothetical protein